MAPPPCITWAAGHNFNDCKTGEVTHNAMDARTSSLKMPTEYSDEWHDRIATDRENGVKLYFSETASPDACKLFFDLDLKRKDMHAEEFEQEFLRPVALLIHGVIVDMYGYLENNKLMTMVVLVRALKEPTFEHTPVSGGAHIYCPFITSTRAVMTKVRSVSLYLCLSRNGNGTRRQTDRHHPARRTACGRTTSDGKDPGWEAAEPESETQLRASAVRAAACVQELD
jgi:hypothetical protein